MANDNFVNYTGLGYFLNRIKLIFAGKTEFDALDAKVDSIIAEGGEPNVIEQIKVGENVIKPDANKAVDLASVLPSADSGVLTIPDSDGSDDVTLTQINPVPGVAPYVQGVAISGGDGFDVTLPSKTYVDENGGKIDVIKKNGVAQAIDPEDKSVNFEVVDLVKEDSVWDVVGSDGLHVKFADNPYGLQVQLYDAESSKTYIAASLEYVDENGGKIDVIKLNGTEQTIVNKEVDLTVITSEQVDEAINEAIAGITQFDFQVVTELPTEGVKGIIYLVAKGTGKLKNVYDEYIWTGTDFEQIGDTQVDLSGYWQEDELVAVTTAEIDALFE